MAQHQPTNQPTLYNTNRSSNTKQHDLRGKKKKLEHVQSMIPLGKSPYNFRVRIVSVLYGMSTVKLADDVAVIQSDSGVYHHALIQTQYTSTTG